MNLSQFNEDSNSLSIGFGPLQMRVQRPRQHQGQNIQLVLQKIKLLDHRLVTTATVFAPIKLHDYTFRNQLKNFRFDKKQKFQNHLIVQSRSKEEKQSQLVFRTLQDLYENWREKPYHKFYITFTNNGDLFYFFHKPIEEDLKTNTKKGGTFAILSCKKSNYSTIVKDWKIQYETMQKHQSENERLLIKNNHINRFWKQFVVASTQKALSFQIVSNFYFMNSLQILPIQSYNGIQQRPQYEYLADKRQNIFGEIQKEVFRIDLQGQWLKQNLEKMYYKLEEMLKGKKFDIQFKCHLGSQKFEQQCQNL